RTAPDRIPRRAELGNGLHAEDRAQEGTRDGRAAIRGRRKLHQEAAGAGEEGGRPQRSLPVRQREEVQKMLRKLVLVLAGLPLGAAILPDHIGEFARGEITSLAAQDPALYQEFGWVSSEQAQYTATPGNSPGKRFTATAWRLRDSTGALALFEAQRPAPATPAKLSALSAKTPDGAIFAYGNYVFEVTGTVPEQKDLEMLFVQLPQLDNAPLPALASNLPGKGLIANSERYILGPASLARFEPRIAPSLAAFHLGTEAQIGRYRTPKGDLTLAIFSYPTPNIARERLAE